MPPPTSPASPLQRIIVGAVVIAVLLLSAYFSRNKVQNSSNSFPATAPVLQRVPEAPPSLSQTPAARPREIPGVPIPRTRPASPTVASASDRFPTIHMDALPREALRTIQLIDKGGPFPYSQDGVVFQNRERRLPALPTGSYHEYTVITPGASDRGARRIIAGPSGTLYYTDDHYATFKRVFR